MTENTNVNIPLLKIAVNWVEQQAALDKSLRAWYQGDWVNTHADNECGTTFCVAGYIGQMFDPAYRTRAVPDGKAHVSDFAAQALGLTKITKEYWTGTPVIVANEDAGRLFKHNNTAEDVRRIAEDIAGVPL